MMIGRIEFPKETDRRNPYQHEIKGENSCDGSFPWGRGWLVCNRLWLRVSKPTLPQELLLRLTHNVQSAQNGKQENVGAGGAPGKQIGIEWGGPWEGGSYEEQHQGGGNQCSEHIPQVGSGPLPTQSSAMGHRPHDANHNRTACNYHFAENPESKTKWATITTIMQR